MATVPDQIDPFPHVHVRPAHGWVNDPNGVGHWDGRWHVMYQWNPDEPQHCDIHWGHMSSADLLSWHDEGVALRPRTGRIDAAGTWSGVAVDEPDGVALVYTAVPDHARNAGVAVARRGPDGSWMQPDLVAAEHPDHTRWADARDPFVAIVGGRRLGILGAGRAEVGPLEEATAAPWTRRGVVLVYDAVDLDEWTLLGELLCGGDLPEEMVAAGAIWECPQLLPIGDRWLLVVSWDVGARWRVPAQDGGLPSPQGVTGYLGDLDLSGPVPRFVAVTEAALDHGPDFYAPQLMADGDRILAWGWSWEGRGSGTNHRPESDVAASRWAGTLTFPREVIVGASGYAMCVPARELVGLVGEPLSAERADGCWCMETSAPAWTLTSAGGVQLDLVDESGHERPVWSCSATEHVRVFVDGSIVEAFTDFGSTTLRAYPAPGERWRARSNCAPRAATMRTAS